MSTQSKFITVAVSDELYRALIGISNEYGQKPGDFAEKAIEHGIEAMLVDGFLVRNKTIDLWRFHYKVTERMKAYKILVDAASHLAKMPDEGQYEELESLATENGFSIEKIMSEATEITPSLIDIADNSQIANAVFWLNHNMEPGKEYLAKDIKRFHNDAGIKDWAIKEAKRVIGVKSLKRNDGSWIWLRPVLSLKTGEEVQSDYQHIEAQNAK